MRGGSLSRVCVCMVKACVCLCFRGSGPVSLLVFAILDSSTSLPCTCVLASCVSLTVDERERVVSACGRGVIQGRQVGRCLAGMLTQVVARVLPAPLNAMGMENTKSICTSFLDIPEAIDSSRVHVACTSLVLYGLRCYGEVQLWLYCFWAF